MKNKKVAVRRLSKLSLTTLIAVYVLILVGGIVRCTGSGMGCPDWPKCFGQWVPPSDANQLPENYKEVYSAKRQSKNEKFARYLTLLGFEESATRILNDESILIEGDFNKYRTWTEYVNRLVGVLIGLFITATFVLSVPFMKTNRDIFIVALSSLLLVIFQGWIGSIVVSTNLVPWTITLHMMLALLIVALLVYLVYATRVGKAFEERKNKSAKLLLSILGVGIVLTLIQVVFGTQVREAIDRVAVEMNYTDRENWIDNTGTVFPMHRSFSWLIVIVHGLFIYYMIKRGFGSNLVGILGLTVLLSAATGIVLNYLGFPAAVQPLHLLLGTIICGIQFYLFLQLRGGSTKLKEALI